jgi:UPF0716 family protein affecting phage T7 exclusion
MVWAYIGAALVVIALTFLAGALYGRKMGTRAAVEEQKWLNEVREKL